MSKFKVGDVLRGFTQDADVDPYIASLGGPVLVVEANYKGKEGDVIIRRLDGAPFPGGVHVQDYGKRQFAWFGNVNKRFIKDEFLTSAHKITSEATQEHELPTS